MASSSLGDISKQNIVRNVWNKGKGIKGYDRDEWRRDVFGNAIRFSKHGNRDSKFGWEIDHIVPVADGGSDILTNLRPLQWDVNVRCN